MAYVARTQYPVGYGMPGGGTAGQVLAKETDLDYDQQWIDPPAGAVPAAGSGYSYSNLLYAYKPDFTNSFSLAINATVYLPVYVPVAVTISSISTYIFGTVAGARIQYAVCDNSATFTPGNLIASSTVSTTQTAKTVLPLAISCQLGPGWMWLSACNNFGTAALTIATTLQPYMTGMPIMHWGNATSPAKAPQVGPYYTATSAPVSNPAVNPALTAATVPYISYKVA